MTFIVKRKQICHKNSKELYLYSENLIMGRLTIFKVLLYTNTLHFLKFCHKNSKELKFWKIDPGKISKSQGLVVHKHIRCFSSCVQCEDDFQISNMLKSGMWRKHPTVAEIAIIKEFPRSFYVSFDPSH